MYRRVLFRNWKPFSSWIALYNTNWDAFKDSCTDLDELIDIVVNYITFCEGTIIPRKTVTDPRLIIGIQCKSLKNSLIMKKIAYYQGDIIQQKEAQKIVKREIKLAKMQYNDKVQDKLRMGNSRSAWRGLKSMLGIQDKKRTLSKYWQIWLHPGRRVKSVLSDSTQLTSLTNCPTSGKLQQVGFRQMKSAWSTFEKINARKCHRPDGISGWLIKCCTPFLSLYIRFPVVLVT